MGEGLNPFLQSCVNTLLDSFRRGLAAATGPDTKQHRGVGETSSTSNNKCRRLKRKNRKDCGIRAVHRSTGEVSWLL